MNERFVAAGSSISADALTRVPWVWLGASRHGIVEETLLSLSDLGGLPLADGGEAMDINNEEFVVGSHGPFDPNINQWQDVPYVWELSSFDAMSGQVIATALSLQGASTGVANGVNEEPGTPQIVGTLSSPLFIGGFRHRSGDPASNDDALLPLPGTSGAIPIDIKTRAAPADPFWIGGWSQNPGLQQPCQEDWEPTYWTIDPINGPVANLIPEPYLVAESTVRGTNESEDLVGYSTPEPNSPLVDCQPRAYAWQGLLGTDLHSILPFVADRSIANGIANRTACDTVEVAGASQVPERALLWRYENGVWAATNLATASDLSSMPVGFELQGALDVNDCGAVLAFGVTPAGVTRLVLLLPTGADRPCPADLDGDCAVGAGDLAVLLGAWGAADCGTFDADFDRTLDIGAPDLATLLGAWGPCEACNPACDAVGVAGAGAAEAQSESNEGDTELNAAIAFATAALGFASFEGLTITLTEVPAEEAAALAEQFRAYLLFAPSSGGEDF